MRSARPATRCWPSRQRQPVRRHHVPAGRRQQGAACSTCLGARPWATSRCRKSPSSGTSNTARPFANEQFWASGSELPLGRRRCARSAISARPMRTASPCRTTAAIPTSSVSLAGNISHDTVVAYEQSTTVADHAKGVAPLSTCIALVLGKTVTVRNTVTNERIEISYGMDGRRLILSVSGLPLDLSGVGRRAAPPAGSARQQYEIRDGRIITIDRRAHLSARTVDADGRQVCRRPQQRARLRQLRGGGGKTVKGAPTERT